MNDFEKGTQNSKAEAIHKLKEDLKSFWALNWTQILQSLQEVNLTPEEKTEFAHLTVEHIQRVFKSGQFRNLEGIEPVLDFLGINDIEFTDSHTENILSLYRKYPLTFLLLMSPSLFDGKLQSGEEYKPLEYVRALLQKSGATPEELTDEYVQNLLDNREILVRLHSNRRLDQAALTGGLRLKEFRHLLSD